MNIIKELNVKRLEEICGKKLTIFQRQAINEWAKEYEKTVISEYRREFEHYFQDNLEKSIDRYTIALAYTLHFGETTRFGIKRLNSIMRDMRETVELLGSKEYSAEEYLLNLKNDGIDLKINL